MLNACANFRLPMPGLLLVMAGRLVLPLALAGQTAAAPALPSSPAQKSSSAPLPAAVQAQLDKLTDALKAARAASDAKAEVTTLNQIGRLHYQRSTGLIHSPPALILQTICDVYVFFLIDRDHIIRADSR